MSQHNRVQSKKLLGILLAFFLAGCGNEFRPVAIPIPQPPGTPQAAKQAVVIASSSIGGGTSTNINVSGNTVAAVRDVGNPVHAALAAGQSRTVVVNDNDTLTTYLTLGNLSSSPTTISLPSGLEPVFVHSREASNAYVALHAPNPDCGGKGSVAVVSMSSLTLIGTVCAGDGPIALTELPNASKLYVANELSNKVTVINTADRTISTTIDVGSTPSAIDVSADGSFVYVANKGSGTVTVIDAVNDTVRGTVTVGNTPTFLKYDDSKKRVYVVNSDSGSVSLIDANPASPTFLSSPAGTLPVGISPTAVTALANGAKAYVANKGSDSVTVIDANTQTVIGTVAVGAGPVAIDSSPDSAQVFVADNGPASSPHGNVTVIRTSNDTKSIDIALPPPPSLAPGTPAPVITPKGLFVTP